MQHNTCVELNCKNYSVMIFLMYCKFTIMASTFSQFTHQLAGVEKVHFRASNLFYSNEHETRNY